MLPQKVRIDDILQKVNLAVFSLSHFAVSKGRGL